MWSVKNCKLAFSSGSSAFTCARIFVSISLRGSGFAEAALASSESVGLAFASSFFFASTLVALAGIGRRGSIAGNCAVLYAHAASTCAP